jgi:hypothetical protein
VEIREGRENKMKFYIVIQPYTSTDNPERQPRSELRSYNFVFKPENGIKYPEGQVDGWCNKNQVWFDNLNKAREYADKAHGPLKILAIDAFVMYEQPTRLDRALDEWGT